MKSVVCFVLAMLACAACAAFAHSQADPLLLVTDDEAAREAAAPPSKKYRTRAIAAPDAPRIKVISPNLLKDVFTAPLPIEMKFSAAGDAEIDPASFKATYGFLHVDITNRITQSVKVTKTGFSVAEAAIPKGSHRLTLQVSDTKGRVGESELKFTVE